MDLRTCVTPSGFRWAVHRPSYTVDNLRLRSRIQSLGRLQDGQEILNQGNYPAGPVRVDQATAIFEIPNAFPFRGATYIDASWADPRAERPDLIRILPPEGISLTGTLSAWAARESVPPGALSRLAASLPRPMRLALAVTSADPDDLKTLARQSCDFTFEPGSELPTGLSHVRDQTGRPRPLIHDHDLFEAVANNPHLPDAYKEVMVLRPGAQGSSEIMGEVRTDQGRTHIFEYLRRNSYIPWGHYAANFADDAVRYRAADLTLEDMRGLRRLYAQRTYARLATGLDLPLPPPGADDEPLEVLRRMVLDGMASSPEGQSLPFTATLWGWNFGFDFAPSGYRLHASHQQVHQQNALIPARVRVVANGEDTEETMAAYGCGDLVAETVQAYFRQTGRGFFDDYLQALRSNQRTDGKVGQSDLIVFEDDQVLLFVPKAQTSQWELQLMPKPAVGNILEAGPACRASLDLAMLLAVRTIENLGARMVTVIEYPKRFDDPGTDQRLLYAFLPRLPWSPGAFSEAQLRCISGHYPEDFAQACRRVMPDPGTLDRPG